MSFLQSRTMGKPRIRLTNLARPHILPSSYRLYSSNSNQKVRILEAGPRDGLQNIKKFIPTATKLELIQRLAAAGLRDIEPTSSVSAKMVPQMADGSEIVREMLKFQEKEKLDLSLPVLVAPSLKYLHEAHKAGAKDICVFASATEAFSKANQNSSIEEILTRVETVTKEALNLGMRVRGSVVRSASITVSIH